MSSRSRRSGAPAPGRRAETGPIRLLDVFTRQVEVDANLDVVNEQLKDHESRLRVLESTRSWMIGAAVAISAVVSGLGTWIGLALIHH